MGRKNYKKKKTNQKKQLVAPVVTSSQPVVKETIRPVTIKEKNDTMAGVDFFGFAPKLFMTDLKRTGWATLAILVILGVIYFVTK